MRMRRASSAAVVDVRREAVASFERAGWTAVRGRPRGKRAPAKRKRRDDDEATDAPDDAPEEP